jgi:hypothetical protein
VDAVLPELVCPSAHLSYCWNPVNFLELSAGKGGGGRRPIPF